MDTSARDPGILTAAEVGARLGLRTRRVELLAAVGDIPGQPVGRGFRFSWTAVCASIAGPEVTSPATLAARAAVLRMAAEDVAERLGLQTATVEHLAAAGEIAGEKTSRGWLFDWAPIYQSIAGPGIPDGEIVTLKELARRLGTTERVARTGFARGSLPGRQVGKKKLFAMEAIRARMGARPAAVPVAGPMGASPPT